MFAVGEDACLLFVLTSPPAGPPVNVAMAIEVASIDHISEANMVILATFPHLLTVNSSITLISVKIKDLLFT